MKIEHACVPIDLDAQLGHARGFVEHRDFQREGSARLLRQRKIDPIRMWACSRKPVCRSGLEARPVGVTIDPYSENRVPRRVCIINAFAAELLGRVIEPSDLPHNVLLRKSAGGNAGRQRKGAEGGP